MPTVIVDGREITVPERPRLNGIQAAKLAGIEIPYYCWHPGLPVVGSCRMCLVEVGIRDAKTGHVVMQPKLVPACNTPAVDGTVFVTNSEKVRQARARVEEGLLLRHPIDCPICDKAGECVLQDYHFEHGQPQRRADLRPFSSRRRDIGDVTLFVDRCILCSRCVRFAAEVSGTHELMVTGRGAHEEIDVLPGFPLHNSLSGNVVDLCPVGALGDKDFLYRQRVWFLQQHRSACTGCAAGCSIWIEENQDRIWRIKPRENPHLNQWWICNEGRYGYAHVHDPRRITQPQRREGQTWTDLHWSTLPVELDTRLRAVKGDSPVSAETRTGTVPETRTGTVPAGRLAAVLSPFLTVEEAYLLCKYIRGIDPNAVLAMGPVPVVGEDERFPKGFVVFAEKCPNRRGVEAVIAHFARRAATFDEILKELDRGTIRGIWVAGGYKTDWIDQATADRFGRLDLLVVQDLFPSPLSERATFVLPAAACAERDGSYVNRADRLQTAEWAVRPPSGVRSEGSLYWELLRLPGLYNARAALDEAARDILYFSAAVGAVPETGIDLKVNLLAQGGTGEDNTA
jgi:NADH-quinone oxidoreductase subunit G